MLVTAAPTRRRYAKAGRPVSDLPLPVPPRLTDGQNGMAEGNGILRKRCAPQKASREFLQRRSIRWFGREVSTLWADTAVKPGGLNMSYAVRLEIKVNLTGCLFGIAAIIALFI